MTPKSWQGRPGGSPGGLASPSRGLRAPHILFAGQRPSPPQGWLQVPLFSCRVVPAGDPAALPTMCPRGVGRPGALLLRGFHSFCPMNGEGGQFLVLYVPLADKSQTTCREGPAFNISSPLQAAAFVKYNNHDIPGK